MSDSSAAVQKSITISAQGPEALSFNGTTFDVVERGGKQWLQAADIARALGYAREDAVSRIYERNADEFSSDMSETVKLTVSGNLKKEARIFSLRGAHLLAMFARTKVAKAFRKWVLDVLDREVERLTQEQATAPSMSLTGCGDKTKVKKFLIAMRKRAVQHLVHLDKQIAEWEVLDAPPPTVKMKFQVEAVWRAPSGEWVMDVVSGMCGLRISAPNKVMPKGGVKVGDKLAGYHLKSGNPWNGPWVKMEHQEAKAPAALKYEYGTNYAALGVAA